jgi:hypothetical protein
MSTDDDEWRRGLENDIAGINETLQLILLQNVNRDHFNVLTSVSNPANSALPTSTSCETRREHSSDRSGAHSIKPASLNEFMGDRTKGHAFFNSCELYAALASHHFADDHARIMWAFSFMKGGRAARFVNRHMHSYQTVGSLPYSSWADFVVNFVAEFYRKNKVQTSRTELETSKYFQGPRTVDEYVDEFREMIDHAQYLEGSHIVLKFHQGLNPKIQDHVACLTSGRPSDESPTQWYEAAILCDENCLANEAFRAALLLKSEVAFSAV